MPKALILTSTQPGLTTGISTSLTFSSSALHGLSNTTAFISLVSFFDFYPAYEKKPLNGISTALCLFSC
jgi:hypothetical protein